jgi:hypothetical protein
MPGAFDDGTSEQGAFERDVRILPNPLPNLYSDADWYAAMQRYQNMQRASRIPWSNSWPELCAASLWKG